MSVPMAWIPSRIGLNICSMFVGLGFNFMYYNRAQLTHAPFTLAIQRFRFHHLLTFKDFEIFLWFNTCYVICGLSPFLGFVLCNLWFCH